MTDRQGNEMLGRRLATIVLLAAAFVATSEFTAKDARAAGQGQPTDWSRFYHYPYVYYPHNFQRQQQQYDHLYYKYPASRQIPVYNQNWYNFYPTAKPYHRGHHFILDAL
jgi:hypothetical protein